MTAMCFFLVAGLLRGGIWLSALIHPIFSDSSCWEGNLSPLRESQVCVEED